MGAFLLFATVVILDTASEICVCLPDVETHMSSFLSKSAGQAHLVSVQILSSQSEFSEHVTPYCSGKRNV